MLNEYKMLSFPPTELNYTPPPTFAAQVSSCFSDGRPLAPGLRGGVVPLAGPVHGLCAGGDGQLELPRTGHHHRWTTDGWRDSGGL